MGEIMQAKDNNREFLIADIVAMLPESKDTLWLEGLSIIGLYHLWQDLVNLTTAEAI
jgi:hypothetical protein